mgnify:CR=1
MVSRVNGPSSSFSRATSPAKVEIRFQAAKEFEDKLRRLRELYFKRKAGAAGTVLHPSTELRFNSDTRSGSHPLPPVPADGDTPQVRKGLPPAQPNRVEMNETHFA